MLLAMVGALSPRRTKTTRQLVFAISSKQFDVSAALARRIASRSTGIIQSGPKLRANIICQTDQHACRARATGALVKWLMNGSEKAEREKCRCELLLLAAPSSSRL
jgi:hypothetical protein